MTRRAVMTTVLTIVGVIGFVWILREAGTQNVLGQLSRIGVGGFAGVLALSFLRYVLRSAAWVTLMDARVPLMSAVAASIAGDVVGQVTPFSVIASEPAKAMYLRSDVPPSRALAALVAENLFYTLSLAVFIVAGVISMLATFDLRVELRVVAILSLVGMTAVLAVLMWMVWRSPAVASAALTRIPGVNAARFVDRVRAFEDAMYEFVRQRPHRLRNVVACEVAFHVVSFSESLLVLTLLTGHVQPLQAFILDTANRIINVVVRVPFKIGFDETAGSLVGDAIGVGNAGLAIALVRKGRLIVWAVVGGILLLRRGMQRPTGSVSVS